jgi:hypothetical protein
VSGWACAEVNLVHVTVLELVDRERSSLSRIVALWGAALAVAAVATVLATVAAVLDGGRWMAMPAAMPFLAWFAAVMVVAGTAVLTARRLAREAGTTRVAGAIEDERGLRSGALRCALEVAHIGALGRRGASDMAARLTAVAPRPRASLAPRLRRRVVRRAVGGVALAVVAVGTMAATALTAPDGWNVVAHPVRAWRGTLLPPLRVEAPVDVPRGQEARVRIAAPGRQRVAIHVRATGAAWAGGWYPVAGGYVSLATPPVAAEVAVVATDGRTTSDTVVVRASDRPFVGSVALRAVYPAYLHRADEALPAGEVARVPRGTRIEITGRASIDLRTIVLVRGADSVPLQPDGRRFGGRLLAETAGQWGWRAAGVAAPITDVPPPLELDVIPDSAPRIDIVSPARDTVVTPGDRVPVSIVASDDHGLASVVLRSWRASAGGATFEPVVQHVSDDAVASWSGVVALDLAGRGLEPGDVLRVVAQATDGSPWHQVAQSRELVLRVPSLAEQRVLVRAAADSAVATAAATAAAQRQLQQRTQDAARARGSRSGTAGGTSTGTSPHSSLSYDAAERAKSLAKEQRDLAGRVDQLQRQAQQLERQLKQAGALDSGLAARLHEAQQLLRDALTPELRDQLSRLDGSADSLRGGDTRQSLADLAQQQQRLREQLERSVDVLKRAALEGAMQTLRDEARDIAKQERAQARGGASNQAPRTGGAPTTHDAAHDAAQDAAHDGARTSARDGSADSARSGGRDAARTDTRAQDRAENGASPRPSPDSSGAPSAAPSAPSAPSAPGAAQRPGPDQPGAQLADRSRALSRDAEQLAKRLAAEKAQTGAQRVGAARDRVDSSAQSMAGRDASTAAGQMDRAAQQLGEARQAQIDEWKSALTSELDRSIQETLHLSRQETNLAQRAQQGESKPGLQAEQSAVQQGTERTSERLQQAGRQSALVSGNSQRAVGQARAQVQAATRDAEQTQQGTGGAQQTASSMRAAADALNRAAAALVRDRERAASASSASGLSEMLQEMQDLAKAQGALNAQAQGLSFNPGGKTPGASGANGARGLAERQRKVAESLDQMGDGDGTGRAQGLAAEAHQITDALERSGLDAQTLVRQQRLYHRLLDAGHTLEQDERDSTGKRVAQAATGGEQFTPSGAAAVVGKAAARFSEPSWAELRGLTADERQLVLEYFKRINAQSP